MPRGTVYIVDDDLAVLKTLAALFESAGLRARTYGSPSSFLEIEDWDGPGCIVMDVRMPEMSGFELYRKARDRGIELPVLFLTGYGEVPSAVEAMKAGAVDFLEKPPTHQDLLDRVQDALTAGTEDMKARAERREVERRFATLTNRERDVLFWVASCLTSRRIAEELEICVKTVEAHRSRIKAKMGATNVAELVRMVTAAGIHLEPTSAPDEAR